MQLLILTAIIISLSWTSSAESLLPLKWEESITKYNGNLFELGVGYWYDCPEGMVVSGFISNVGTGCYGIYCLEGLECVKPALSNNIELVKNQECYDMDIGLQFDGKFGDAKVENTWLEEVECDAGYFVRGIYSGHDLSTDGGRQSGLEHFEALRCCKYDEDIIGYEASTTRHSYGDCLDPVKNVVNHKCNVKTNKFITGFSRLSYQSPSPDSPDTTGYEKCFWMWRTDICHNILNGVLSLKYALVRSLYLKQAKGCKVIDDKLQDEDAFMGSDVSADSIASIEYKNSRSDEYEVPTLSTTTCKKQENTFTYKSGFEKSYGFDVSFSFSTGIIGVDVTAATSFNMQWTENKEFTTTTSQSENVCIEKPSENYKCPARTTCKRSFVSITSPNGEYPIELTIECEGGKKYTTNGVISTTGYRAIRAIDSQLPLDCIHYTDDYYSRGNGKLFACDTCHTNANTTNICDVCRDGYIELNGQCVTAATCDVDCGGEVKGSGINPNGPGPNQIPWSGAYCDIIDENKFNTKECQADL